MSFLTNLQSKSSTVKGQFAFVFASVITGLIGIVWMSTVPARFSEVTAKNVQNNAQVKSADTQNTNEFFDTAKAQLGNLFQAKNAEPDPTTDEIDADLAPNMANLNRQDDTTVYSVDDAKPTLLKGAGYVVPPDSIPPDTLEDNPGITMPAHVAPQAVPPHIPDLEKTQGEKKALIEVTSTPPKPILIETRGDTQKAPQN